MKYYTIQWWSDLDGNPGEEYWAYLESIFGRLPASLQSLSKEVSLHDARLRVFNFDSSASTLQIELDGCGYDQQLKTYFDRSFCLTYRDVRSIKSTADPKIGLPGPHGYGDLGYDELELLESDLYEHRMLFSTGIELQVKFSSFSLTWKDKS